MNEARLVRMAEREAAKRAREAEQAERAAELAAQAQREAEEAEALLAAQSAERTILLEAEQKAAREAIDHAGAEPVRAPDPSLPRKRES
jgi:hypothetical protein